MNNSPPNFFVSNSLKKKGLKIKYSTFSVSQVPKRRGGNLSQKIDDKLATLNINELLSSPIIAEYKRLQSETGIEQPVAPAEYLLKLIKKSGMLPNINRLVDCYNLASVETALSMGAHDLSGIKGDLKLDITDGSEKYTPLLSHNREQVNPGEYAVMDEEKIICRLDVKQCDETKCTQDTRNFLVYVQGNQETSEDYVQQGLDKVCDYMHKYCYAEYAIHDEKIE